MFLKRFEQYATELTENGQPKHKELVDRIAVVRLEGQSRWEDMSDKKISSAAIVASKQALTDVYWYKCDLRSFLTSTLSDAAILGRLDWDDYKRNIVGLAVDFLVRNQTRYQADLLRLMTEEQGSPLNGALSSTRQATKPAPGRVGDYGFFFSHSSGRIALSRSLPFLTKERSSSV